MTSSVQLGAASRRNSHLLMDNCLCVGRDDGVNAGEFSPVFYNTWVTYSIVRVDLGPDLGLS